MTLLRRRDRGGAAGGEVGGPRGGADMGTIARGRRISGVILLAGVMLFATRVQAQDAARTFEARFAEVWNLAPAADNAAETSNLAIDREQARFELTSGRMVFLTPLDGRTVGAVWQ